MNILIVVRKLTMGGLQKQVITFAQGLQLLGHNVHILILKSEKASKELKIPSGITVHRPNFHKKFFTSLKGLCIYLYSHFISPLIIPKSKDFYVGNLYSDLFAKYVNKQEEKTGKFDLIFIRGHGAFEYLHKICGKNIFNFVDGNPHEYLGNKGKSLNFEIFNNKNFICVSKQLEQTVKIISNNCNAICKTIYSPCALNINDIKQKSIEPTNFSIPQKYIVSVGRLVEGKNLSFLLDCMSLLPQTINLVIVGDGPLRNQLKNKCIDLNIMNRVFFLGSVDNPYPYIKNAQVLVHTSKKEGFGLIFLEALILDTPIVATESIGGMRDILKGEILENQIVKPDINKLAEKILETINKPYHSETQMFENFDYVENVVNLLEKISHE